MNTPIYGSRISSISVKPANKPLRGAGSTKPVRLLIYGGGRITRKSDMCILLPIEQPAGKFGHTNTDTSRTILFASV